MPIENYTDEDIAGLFTALQANTDADTAEQTARASADTTLNARIDSLIIPLPGELDPNILQQITVLQLAQQQEVADREEADASLQASIDTFVTGADPALVDTHTTQIADLDTRITANDALIAANALSISEEVTNRTNQYDDEVVPQFTAITDQLTLLDSTLTQEVTDRATADLSVATQIDAVNATVLNLQSLIANEEAARIGADSSFSDQLSALSGSLAVAQQQILYLSGTGVDPAGALASQLLDLTYAVNALQSDFTDHAGENSTDIQDAQTDVGTLQTTVTTVQDGLTAEITDRTDADVDLQTQITAANTNITANATSISAEVTARTNADTVLNTTLSTLDTTVSTLVSDLADEITTREALSVTVDTLVTDVGGFTGAIAGLQTDVNLLKTEWLLLLDVDNSIAGMQRGDASGPTTDFLLTAERIALQTAGGTPINPFSIVSDQVVLTDVLMSGGSIASGTIHADNAVLAYSVDPTKTMRSMAITASQLPSLFTMAYGGATSNTFLGSDAIIRVIQAEVYTDANMMLFGANYDVGDNPRRLSKTTDMQFNVQAGGSTNAAITVWYRVKDAPGDGGTWNFAGTFEHGIASGARDYERAGSGFQFSASVGATQVIEFGMNALNGQGLPIDPAFDAIYSGWIQVSAANI